MRDSRRATVWFGSLFALMLILVGCGGTAGASQAGAASAGEPAAATTPAEDPSAGASSDNRPIGGDVGDRSKGSVQAQITGGLTSSVDLPFGAPLAMFGINGANSAYLPFTDPTGGTLFLTITDGQLVIQYAGPNNVGLANGSTPCELKVDVLDASQAKGSFTCKGLLLIQGESLGSADISGTFEGHK